MLSCKQSIYHTNLTDNSKFNKNIDVIIKSIQSGDVEIMKQINQKVMMANEVRLNLIKNLLKSNIIINNNLNDIKKFFVIINPLNNEWNMGSEKWNFKEEKYLYVQNNVLNENLCPIFYEKYIHLIKKILDRSTINYQYKEFVNERYSSITDIVFRFTF